MFLHWNILYVYSIVAACGNRGYRWTTDIKDPFNHQRLKLNGDIIAPRWHMKLQKEYHATLNVVILTLLVQCNARENILLQLIASALYFISIFKSSYRVTQLLRLIILSGTPHSILGQKNREFTLCSYGTYQPIWNLDSTEYP